MRPIEVPFNISILQLNAENLKNIRPIKVLDIYNGSSDGFHPDGLFSSEIFGPVGDERRNYRYSYIDIKVSVFHPMIYRTLVATKKLYGSIMAGTAYAVWDDVAKDFVASNALEGFTGFEFFLSKWKEINFVESGSISREQNIKLLKKYANSALTNKIIVMPAGLRDIETDNNGRMVEDEINPLYRKVLALANTINASTIKNYPEIIDTPRYQIQLNFNNIYESINKLIEGKRKLIMGKWASRRIFNGTRNVFTSMDPSVEELGREGNPSFNSTIIGLYQYLKATLPVSVYQIRKFLEPIFTDVNQPARLVNMETLKSEDVLLPAAYYDHWATNEGIEKIISSFKEESIRNKPIVIDGKYLALIYKGKGVYKVFHSIDELPKGYSVEDVKPITFVEMLFLSVYKDSKNYPCLITRYPVDNIGSIYPSLTHLRATLKRETRQELGDDWMPIEGSICYEYPVIGAPYVNSLIPHPAHLVGLNADFDGDTGSGTICYSDESIEEARTYFQQRQAYIGTDGYLMNSIATSTVNLVMHNLTSE